MEEFELAVILRGGAEHDIPLQATTAEGAVKEAKAFLKVMKARGWQIKHAQVVSIRKTGVLTIKLD